MDSPLLEVRDIVKSFDGAPVLRGVSFDVWRREIVCLLGPSGCGKSTLLNIIAGLLPADGGRVLVDGEDIAGVPVHRRGFGLMFQGLALFPHKNARDNVSFGLRMAGLVAAEIDARARDALAMVGLSGFDRRDVNELSGGEQQRVALARSLAPHPRLLMLDEPLSSLDRTLRERLMDELRVILTRVGQTALYVTHDQQEAFALADRLVIINAGRVAQIGTPLEVYSNPADAFVARFLGFSNLLPGRVSEADPRAVDTAIGRLTLGGESCRAGEVTVLVRPEAVTPDGDQNIVTGTLAEFSFRGRHTRIAVRVQEIVLDFEVDSTRPLPPAGAAIRLALRPDAISCLPQADGGGVMLP